MGIYFKPYVVNRTTVKYGRCLIIRGLIGGVVGRPVNSLSTRVYMNEQ